MLSKRLVCPVRVRRVPQQFSWVDQRLVRECYIDRCDAHALALYLFLVTVADDQGLSYYSDAALSVRLSMDGAALNKACQALIEAQLIAYERPFYQVLALVRLASSASAGRASFGRCGTTRSSARSLSGLPQRKSGKIDHPPRRRPR